MIAADFTAVVASAGEWLRGLRLGAVPSWYLRLGGIGEELASLSTSFESLQQEKAEELESIVRHMSRYTGPGFGDPSPTQMRSWLTAAINHLGAIAQSYGKVGVALEETRRENETLKQEIKPLRGEPRDADPHLDATACNDRGDS